MLISTQVAQTLTNSTQANCDWRQSSYPSSSLSLEEVAVYVHHRVL